MRRFLIIADILAFKHIYSLNLKAYLDAASAHVQNEKEAVEYLANNAHRIDLVLIHNSKNDEKLDQKIIPKLRKSLPNIPILITGGQKTDLANTEYIRNSLDVKSVVRTSAKMINVTAKQMSELEVPDFFSIDIEHFFQIDKTIHDIFLLAPGDIGYKLLFKTHGNVDRDLIKNLQMSGEKVLFVKSINRLAFVNYLTQMQVAKVDSSLLSSNEQVSASSMMNELVSTKLSDLGITPETVNEANSNMRQIAEVGNKSRVIKDLLKNLMKNSDNFLFQHTVMLNFLTHHISKSMSWGLEEKRMKLSFVAFFHDITLKTPDLAQIHTKAELHKAKLSEDNFKLVEHHAHLSAELISKFPHAPMGVDQLIKQHHGSLNGIGFQESYSSSLSPMVLTFIVAEEFTHLLLKNSGHVLPLETMIIALRTKFPTNRFKRIIDGLSQLEM